ncbi:hypothetical protein PENSPDRAFT_648577, partial [Peniophora sp. CONT]
MAQVTGIYPTLILVIVALEQSHLDKALFESKISAFVAAHEHSSQRRSAFSSVLPRSFRRSTAETHETPEDAAMPNTVDVGAAKQSFAEHAAQKDYAGASTIEIAELTPPGKDTEQAFGSSYPPGIQQPIADLTDIPYRPLPVHPISTSTVYSPATSRTGIPSTSDVNTSSAVYVDSESSYDADVANISLHSYRSIPFDVLLQTHARLMPS